jgi:hypothetical protein
VLRDEPAADVAEREIDGNIRRNRVLPTDDDAGPIASMDQELLIDIPKRPAEESVGEEFRAGMRKASTRRTGHEVVGAAGSRLREDRSASSCFALGGRVLRAARVVGLGPRSGELDGDVCATQAWPGCRRTISDVRA